MRRERDQAAVPRGPRRRTLPTAKLAAKAGWRHVVRVAVRTNAPRDPAAALLAAGALADGAEARWDRLLHDALDFEIAPAGDGPGHRALAGGGRPDGVREPRR